MALIRGLAVIDVATLGYAAFASAVILARRAPHAGALVAAHAGLAVAALAAPRLRRGGAAAACIGEFHPLLALAGLYTAIGLVNAGGPSHDGAVQRWEEALFGGQPARDWIRAWPVPALSWTLHVAYLSYYAIVAAAPLALWVTGRRDGARRVAVSLALAFYSCYAVFLIFPVAGPRYLLSPADNAASRVLPARLAHHLLEQAAAWGTAFPSSHVAAALVAAVAAFREWRPLGGVLVPAAGLLTVATVYGQFHYAADALAGVLVAAAVLIFERRR
ncbi:MAG TPA: phosphatase PAP2 family protein [Vicinamibacteria bacterium]|nr:phosphatase PAP2 family protein [Vicinamibacteria bacterium]